MAGLFSRVKRYAPQSRPLAFFYSLWQLIRGIVKEPSPQLIEFTKPGYKLLPQDQEIEEEEYGLSRYYPVRIGDIIEDHYQIVGKLGFGLGSTVWLANEFKAKRSVVLKVFTHDRQNQEETNIYKHLMSVKSKHRGRYYIRDALDFFTIQGPKGEHQCLVHQPMLENTYQLLFRNPTHRFTEDLLKLFLRRLLSALDYLHTDAHLIHTDISYFNILLGIKDQSILKKFITKEQENPSPRKEVEGHTVYISRAFDCRSGKSIGEPVLCDFGSTVTGDIEHDDDVQPNVYRSPEVCLDIPWSYGIDIWNVGCLVWDLFEGKHMFNGIDPKEEKYMTRAHVSEMVALMGLPPPELLKKGNRAAEFFDEDGQWRSDIPLPAPTTLEESELYLEGSNKKEFLRFMRKMIQWRPEDRQTAKELLKDDWLKGRFF